MARKPARSRIADHSVPSLFDYLKAWLVAPELAPVSKPRRPLRGSITLVRDLERFDASSELEKTALRRARRAGLT